MTLRVATVLSAREWEARLVAAARTSASVRLVMRAFRPGDVTERAGSIDVVVVGSETPWATPTRLAAWRRLGLRVVGIHPVGDRPAAERLTGCGVDLVFSDDIGTDTLLREIRLLEPAATHAEGVGSLTVVTGARGAPGRTEVAVAIAWIRSSHLPTTLIDADLDAPGIALRLGIPPRPDLTDAVDRVHHDGEVSPALLHRVGRLGVITGSHRPGDPALRPEPVLDVIDATRAISNVVCDTGPCETTRDLIKAADEAIVVVDASPRGIVRAAAAIAEWTGPPPRLIVNRLRSGRDREVTRSIRRWTGLEPVAAIPVLSAITDAASRATPPPRRLLGALADLRQYEAVSL